MVCKTSILHSLLIDYKEQSSRSHSQSLIGIFSFRFVGKGLIEDINDYNCNFEIQTNVAGLTKDIQYFFQTLSTKSTL